VTTASENAAETAPETIKVRIDWYIDWANEPWPWTDLELDRAKIRAHAQAVYEIEEPLGGHATRALARQVLDNPDDTEAVFAFLNAGVVAMDVLAGLMPDGRDDLFGTGTRDVRDLYLKVLRTMLKYLSEDPVFVVELIGPADSAPEDYPRIRGDG
jgi:hypothetical protein